MEDRFRMRISRIFRGSFGSCRTRNLSDIVEKPVFIPQSHHSDYFHLMQPLPPSSKQTRPFPSICKPNCPETTAKAITNSILPRQKISGRNPPLVSATNGQTCPPASPVSPFLNPFYKERKNSKNKKKKKKNNNSRKTHVKNSSNMNRKDMSLFSSSSRDSAYFEDSYYWTFSSEEEEESDTLFSSRSLSSDSSGYHHRSHRRKTPSSSRRRRTAAAASNKGINSQMDVFPLHGKVKGSFAVVKSSSDPYNDFRTSMVEMIVEKQIFSAKDLEQLLQCFLSLNSDHHHTIILEVFTEIWEALFSTWS